jgi:hypothetical protein
MLVLSSVLRVLLLITMHRIKILEEVMNLYGFLGEKKREVVENIPQVLSLV